MKNKKELVIGILAFLVGIMFLFNGFNLFFAGAEPDKHPPGYTKIEFDFVPIVVILFGIFLIFGGIVILFRIDYILEPRSRTVSTDTCGFFTKVASVSRLRSLIVPS
jgi:nitrate reductase gamma subunit